MGFSYIYEGGILKDGNLTLCKAPLGLRRKPSGSRFHGGSPSPLSLSEQILMIVDICTGGHSGDDMAMTEMMIIK